MPIPKSELNKRLRKQRIAAGLIEVRAWVKPKYKKKIIDFIRELPMNDLVEMAKAFKKIMQCNCDLDNWEPEQSTGHSLVCRIHRRCMAVRRGDAKPPELTNE